MSNNNDISSEDSARVEYEHAVAFRDVFLYFLTASLGLYFAFSSPLPSTIYRHRNYEQTRKRLQRHRD